MSASQLLAPRTIVRHRRSRPQVPESSISVSLSEPSGSGVAWRMRIDALTTGGRSRLGTIITAPPSRMRLGTRVVALACCPGALGWDIVVEPLKPYPANVGGTLRVESSEESAGFGVTPSDGSILVAGPESGPGGAGAYNHATGIAPGAVAVPVGARVRGWSFLAAGGPATAAIVTPIFGALPVITVPAGAGFGDTPDNLIGPVSFVFAGALHNFWVSWRELG